MAETRIITTAPSGLRRLGLHGQLAVAMHRQLATILGNRFGPQHARYLARPVLNPSNGQIDWYATVAGTARPMAALPADEAQRLTTLARQIESEIAQLAAKLKAEGQSAELVGRMLELALVTPGESRNHLYEVGGQPVLILWAHEAEGVIGVADASAPPAVPAPPAQPPARLPEARPAVPPAEAAALGATGAIVAGRSFWGWLTWLLPLALALLLVFLLLRACEPLPPRVVEVPGGAVVDPLPRLEGEEQALRAKLAELNRNRAVELAQCGPLAPPPEPARPPLALPPKAEVIVPPPVVEAKPLPVLPVPEVKPSEPKPVPTPPAKPPQVQPAPTPPKPQSQAALPPPPAEPKPRACSPTYAPGEEPEVVLIVDGSKSMDELHLGPQSRMDLARRSIEHIVKGLPKAVDVALVEFTTCTDVRRDKFYAAPERGDLINEVKRLTPTGGTPLARSLERAGNIVSGDADATIVVVSDGDDTCHGDPCAVARAIKARKPRVTINVVDLSGERGRAAVQCIASATGGKVLSPQSGADMLQKMQQATRQPDVRQCGP